jgi:phosphoenolpyruvate synthase/pyruvate phosphate dikinase
MMQRKQITNLAKLLKSWGLQNRDFIISGRIGMSILDYSIKKKPSHDVIILLLKNKIPWKIENKTDFEVTPPSKSIFFKGYRKFIYQENISVHFYIESTKYFSRLLSQSIPYKVGSIKVFINQPINYVKFLDKLISYSQQNKICKEWSFRMLNFYLVSLKNISLIKKDKKLFIKINNIIKKHKVLLKNKKSKSKIENKLVINGTSVFNSSVIGEAKVILKDEFKKIKKPSIVITDSISPLIIPYLKNVIGIITDEGGTMSHAAIIAREFKIPALVGTKIATKFFKDGDRIKLDANNNLVKRLK